MSGKSRKVITAGKPRAIIAILVMLMLWTGPAIHASGLIAPPPGYIPLGGLVTNNYQAWEPATNSWVPGNAAGLSEGDVAPMSLEVDGATVDNNYYFTVCLQYVTSSNGAYAFIDLDPYNVTFSPTLRGGSISSTLSGVSSDGATIDYVNPLAQDQSPCDIGGSVDGIGYEIGLTANTSGTFYIYYGAELARAGATTELGVVVLPGEGVGVWPFGTFQTFLGNVTGKKTVNFQPSDVAVSLTILKLIDTDRDGSPDLIGGTDTDPLLAGYTIELCDDGAPSGDPSCDTATTDSSGQVTFSALVGGYEVYETLVASGYEFVTWGGDCTNIGGVTNQSSLALADIGSTCTVLNQSAGAPSIMVEKSSTTTSLSAPGTVTYSYVVTNTGTVVISGLLLSDDNDNDDMSCAATTLTVAPDAGSVTTCTATHSFTQAELNANGSPTARSGILTNNVTASSNEAPDVFDDLDIPIVQNPVLAIDKTLAANADEDNSNDISLGDTLTYQIVVTNTGNLTLNNVVVTDTLIAGLTCVPSTPATLPPGDFIMCSGSHVVAQADVDTGQIVNTASADSTEVGPVDDTASAPVPQRPALAIDKTLTANADEDSSNDVSLGDTLTYQIFVTNTGNLTLNNVVITDTLIAGLTCGPTPPATLSPGAIITCLGTYIVTQIDVDAGKIINTAAVNSDEVGPVDDSFGIPIGQTPLLLMEKELQANADEDNSSDVSLGDTLTFQIVATNSGNATLNNVTVVDSLINGLSCIPTTPATLAPNERLVCTGNYVVTQANVDVGEIINTATADSEETGPVDDKVITPVPQRPAMSIDKTLASNADEDGSGNVSLGDTLTYQIIVANDGNVTLQQVIVDDTLIAGLSCAPQTPGVLAPTETMTCTGNYVVTQADIDTGEIINVATADSDETGPETDTVTVPAPQQPALTIVKRMVSNADEDSSGTVSLGDTLTYQIVVTNTGNLTLNDTTVSDPKLPSMSCTPSPPTTLAPGAAITCTGAYIVTQSDVDAGQILNIAATDSDQTDPQEDDEIVDVPQMPSLSIDKYLEDFTDPDGSGQVSVGDTLIYKIIVVNDGNVTLFNVIVEDPLLADLACDPEAPATLIPDGLITCTGTYVVTEADAEEGFVHNTAIVRGESDEVIEVEGQDEEDVEVQTPTAIDDPDILPPEDGIRRIFIPISAR